MADPAGRYEALPTWSRLVHDGVPVVLREPRVVPPPTTDGAVTVGAGDRLDHLAARLLADPYAWWRLADANPGVPLDALDEAGRVLRLPGAP